MSVVLLCIITLQLPVPPRGDAGPPAGFERRHEQLSLTGGAPPLEIEFLFSPGFDRQDRFIAAAKDALGRFAAWFGPLGTPSVTIVDGGWRAAVPAEMSLRESRGDAIVVPTRWLSPEIDVTLEQAVFTAIGRAYWPAAARAAPDAFADGLARYSAARAMNDALDGRDLQSYRYFGGFVPHTVRAVSLTRPRRDPRPPIFRRPAFDGALASSASDWLPAPSRADRAAAALVTLERLIGWPAMQAALLEFRTRSGGMPFTAERLAAVVGEQRGSDVPGFVAATESQSGDVDYVLEDLATSTRDGRHQATVRVRRHGSIAFPVPIVTRFADGTESVDWWHGEDASRELTFVAASEAVAASVDPATTVVLDDDRSNNTRTRLATFSRAGARLTVSWAIWLQDLVLTYASLV